MPEIIDKLRPKFKQIIELNHKKRYMSDTVELPAVTLRFKDICLDSFAEVTDLFTFNDKKAANDLVYSIFKLEASDGKFRAYDLSRYVGLRKGVQQLQRRPDIETSRQLSVTFDQLHCFQFIQFMKRGDNIYTNVGMRSCNLYENFLYDMFLSFAAAAYVMNEPEINIKTDMTFLIGSLHVFKKDLNDFEKDISKYVV